MANMKIFIYGFFFIIAVSVVVIKLRDYHSIESKQGDLYILDALDINSKAREVCHPLAQQKVGLNLDKNPNAQNEGTTKSTVTWKNESAGGPFKIIVCKFEKDKGVVSLTVDDKDVLTAAAR